MKKRISFSAIYILLVLLCIGCTKSGAPSCTDEAVTKLVLDISTEEIQNQMTLQTIAATYRYMLMFPFNVPGNYNTVKQMMNETTGERGDKEFRDHLRKTIDVVDKQFADARTGLTGIRKNGKNDELKKCECAASLSFANGKTHPITYTAQFTEDGKVYVEVSGLK
jgi:hypothetical protein